MANCFKRRYSFFVVFVTSRLGISQCWMTLRDSFSPIHLLPNVIGQNQRVQMILQNRAMNSGGFQLTLSKAFRGNNLCMQQIISMVSVSKSY